MKKADGGFSIVRVGVIAVIVGILIIAGGAISFFVDRASHQTPLEIELYPGATLWGKQPYSNTSQSVYYQVTNVSPEQVKDFYQQKMDQFYSGDEAPELRSCKRNPFSGNFREYDQGSSGVVPYQWSCLFDRNGFQSTQSTRVNIQPGIELNGTAGMTIIEYVQIWQR